jgi:hypothetical protein
MVVLRGRERTLAEYRALLKQGGLPARQEQPDSLANGGIS